MYHLLTYKLWGTTLWFQLQLGSTPTTTGYQELCALDACNDRHLALLGRTERVWFAGSDETRHQTLGRTKNFAKAPLGLSGMGMNQKEDENFP